MITFDLSSENLVSILGALLPFVGAMPPRLALGLKAASDRFAKLKRLRLQPHPHQNVAEQKVDAAYGLGILVVGFFLQGAAGYEYKSRQVT